MKRSPLEIVLPFASCVFTVIFIFHKPLGLSVDWQGPLFGIAAIACWFPVIILQRRRRNARLAAGLPASEKPPTKRGFWLFVMTAGFVLCVAGAFLGPYLVENLSFSRSVISSIITFIAFVVAVAIAWRRQRP